MSGRETYHFNYTSPYKEDCTMKQFLEELRKASINTYDVKPDSSKARDTFNEVARKYKRLEGKKALYTSKTLRDSRVVMIENVGPRYILISYEYYGNVCGKIRTTINYGALISGDDKLEVETYGT